MVVVAFTTGYQFGVNDVLEVTLVHKDVVNELPMFGLRMYPSCFKSVILLEMVLWWQVVAQCKAPAASTRCRWSYQRRVCKYSFPGICILAHSSIEITKDYHLVVETVAELRVELVFFCRFSLKSWSVHTEKRVILLIFQWKAHGHHVVGMTSWHIFQP